MTKPVGRDEHMYCTGAVLLAQGKMIYRDFSYVAQMPYHPLICAALFKLFGTTSFLYVVRMLSTACDIIIVTGIIGIYRCIFASFPEEGFFIGLMAAALYVFNPYVDYANGFAWNHDVVMCCVVSSFWLYIYTSYNRKSKKWADPMIGILLTAATFMRITTGLILVLFFIVLILRPAKSLIQKLKDILPFVTMVLLLSIWPVWVIAQAPQAAYLNLYKIPLLNGRLLQEMGTFYKKSDLMLDFISTPGPLLLALLSAYLLSSFLKNRYRLNITNKKDAILAILLTMSFFFIAFIPPTMWQQYLAMPIPFILISFAYPLLFLRELSDSHPFKIAVSIIAACLFVTVSANLIVASRVPQLFDTQRWVPVRQHKVAIQIKDKTKNPKLMLSLSPLFAIEGGCDIYPQLSAGPFAYRVADYLTPAERAATHTIGPKELQEMIGVNPPSVVAISSPPDFFEVSLRDSVVKPGWKNIIYDMSSMVYHKP